MKLSTYEMTVECQKYQSPPKNCQHQSSDVYMYKQQYDKNAKSTTYTEFVPLYVALM